MLELFTQCAKKAWLSLQVGWIHFNPWQLFAEKALLWFSQVHKAQGLFSLGNATPKPVVQ